MSSESLNPSFPSLCIPRVFPNISEFRIRTTIEALNLGSVDRIDMVERRAENGTKYNQVFVHFKTWNKYDTAVKARDQLIAGKEIKIIYDDPWYWKVSAYRPQIERPKPRPYVKPRPNAPPSIVLYDERTPERIPQHPQQRPIKQRRNTNPRGETNQQYIERLTSQTHSSNNEKENKRTVKQEIEDEKL